MSREPIRILGIDTSLRSTGVGVVESSGSALRVISYGTIKNPTGRRHSACLSYLFVQITLLIDDVGPHEAAIEGIFYHKNIKTAVTLGQARGAALAACSFKGVDVFEYSPRHVKQAVVGTGSAHKEQVAQMVKSILGLSELPPDDAADALALAICHLHHRTGSRLIDPKQI